MKKVKSVNPHLVHVTDGMLAKTLGLDPQIVEYALNEDMEGLRQTKAWYKRWNRMLGRIIRERTNQRN